jgi:hypothetical protein
LRESQGEVLDVLDKVGEGRGGGGRDGVVGQQEGVPVADEARVEGEDGELGFGRVV